MHTAKLRNFMLAILIVAVIAAALIVAHQLEQNNLHIHWAPSGNPALIFVQQTQIEPHLVSMRIVKSIDIIWLIIVAGVAAFIGKVFAWNKRDGEIEAAEMDGTDRDPDECVKKSTIIRNLIADILDVVIFVLLALECFTARPTPSSYPWILVIASGTLGFPIFNLLVCLLEPNFKFPRARGGEFLIKGACWVLWMSVWYIFLNGLAKPA